MSMRAPDVEVHEERIVWTWHDAPDPCRIIFDAFRETSEGLKCEVRVETAGPVTDDGRHGLYHWATFNLSSTSARSALCKTLAARTDRNPWALMLELACAKTAELWRRGEPVIDLADEPEPASVEYTVDPVLPVRETTLLVADGDSLKSWLALALALAVRSGQSVGRLRPTRRCRVLYVDYETGRQEVRRRIGWLARGMGLQVVDGIYYREQQRAIADDIAHLREEVRRLDIGLVIVDSLGPAVGDDLEKSGPAIATMRALRSLPCTRLVVAHVSKATAEQKNGRGRAFGSAFFENLARSVWEMRSEESGWDRRAGLFHRKANIGRKFTEPIGLQFSFDDAQRIARITSAGVADVPEIAQYASLHVRLRAALRDGAKTTKELAELLGVQENTLRKTLARLPDVVKLQDERTGRNGSPALWGLRAYED